MHGLYAIIKHIKKEMSFAMLEIINNFNIDGKPTYCEKFGSGHINSTYEVKTDGAGHYVLQMINTSIFSDVDTLMNNILLVTEHLKKKVKSDMQVLELINTLDNKLYYRDKDSNCWRMYNFIEDSISLDRPENTEDFYQSAVAFGEFANLLSDFDASQLGETLKDFHNTIERFNQLKNAISADPLDRVKDVQKEIDFAMLREKEAATMVNMMNSGILPLRVTHNDTKLNNVLLCAKTRKPLCVVDLDSVMPGLLGNDFGDAIRFGASTATEDEVNLDKVDFDIDMYDSFARGYLQTCSKAMTQEEEDTLPLAAKLMTLECGIRFLADYINGDVYFSISRPSHNLDRARTQFKLVSLMEKHFDTMKSIIKKYSTK